MIKRVFSKELYIKGLVMRGSNPRLAQLFSKWADKCDGEEVTATSTPGYLKTVKTGMIVPSFSIEDKEVEE